MARVTNRRVRGFALRPERRRFLLQRDLIAQYRAWRPYQNRMTADLRPRWRCIEGRYGWAWHTSLHVIEALSEDQRWEEEDGLGPHDPDLRSYVEMIDATITILMGLKVDGGPAAWAREYVHLAATSRMPIEQTPGPAYADFPKWERVRIALNVSEDRARLDVEDHDGSVHAGPDIDGSPFLSFTKWDDLRRAAHELVDREIDGLQSSFVSTYKSNYVSRLKSEQNNLPKLRESLSATPNNRPFHDDATWKALDRLSTVIGVDPPQR